MLKRRRFAASSITDHTPPALKAMLTSEPSTGGEKKQMIEK
jgi:hypothetical protein